MAHRHWKLARHPLRSQPLEAANQRISRRGIRKTTAKKSYTDNDDLAQFLLLAKASAGAQTPGELCNLRLPPAATSFSMLVAVWSPLRLSSQ